LYSGAVSHRSLRMMPYKQSWLSLNTFNFPKINTTSRKVGVFITTIYKIRQWTVVLEANATLTV